jgi:hypothetical protein
MGTRSLTIVKEDDQIVMNMYRQMDGYPSGHGLDLAEFLKPLSLCNGIGFNSKNQANGLGCLAAQIVSHFKEGIGGIYLIPAESNDVWQEYEYHITVYGPDIHVTVYGGSEEMYSGVCDENFAKWCREN